MKNKDQEPSAWTLVSVNLKLRRRVRDDLKRITHEEGETMQDVLAAFAESYIKAPDQFRVIKTIEMTSTGVKEKVEAVQLDLLIDSTKQDQGNGHEDIDPVDVEDAGSAVGLEQFTGT